MPWQRGIHAATKEKRQDWSVLGEGLGTRDEEVEWGACVTGW